MTTTEQDWQDRDRSWEHLGRAAEHFARRVARDARRFATHVEAHVGEFAHDVRHDWRCGARAGRHARRGAAPDVRGVFEDIRGVLAAVLDGVDELITSVFQDAPSAETATETAAGWARVVLNREATCGGCGHTLAAGSEGHVRQREGTREFRCLACGVPASA
jgi:hypothetical protein